MSNGTANMYGGDLTGVTFLFGYAPFQTTANPVLNVSHGARVTLTEGAGVTPFTSTPTVNVFSHDTVNLVLLSGNYRTLDSIVNLTPYAGMSGTIQIGTYAALTMNGATGASFNNTNTSVGYNATAQINADVIGTGSFSLSFDSGIGFGGSVSAGQTVDLAGGNNDVMIGDPSAFHGTIDWLAAAGANAVVVDLLGMNADSYKFSDDVLTLFAGWRIVDTLHVEGATSGAFVVAGTSTGITLQSAGTPVTSGEHLLPIRV
jgi:hypothetical protein